MLKVHYIIYLTDTDILKNIQENYIEIKIKSQHTNPKVDKSQTIRFIIDKKSCRNKPRM